MAMLLKVYVTNCCKGINMQGACPAKPQVDKMIFPPPHQALEIQLDSTYQFPRSQFRHYTRGDFYYYVPKDIIYSKELVFCGPASDGVEPKSQTCVNLWGWKTFDANFWHWSISMLAESHAWLPCVCSNGLVFEARGQPRFSVTSCQ